MTDAITIYNRLIGEKNVEKAVGIAESELSILERNAHDPDANRLLALLAIAREQQRVAVLFSFNSAPGKRLHRWLGKSAGASRSHSNTLAGERFFRVSLQGLC